MRRQKSKDTRRKVWAIGVMLEESTDAYRTLLKATGLAVEIAPTPTPIESDCVPERASRTVPAPSRVLPKAKPLPPPHTTVPEELAPEDAIEPRIFRVRVKARSGPRTRLLTLTADSEEEARSLAARDLESAWTVMDVSAA